MRVSQRLDYALKALVLLAGHPEGAYVAAGELARASGLPKRFVEQQITGLAHAGVVTCRRGASGGCALAQPADAITVGDVVVALHGEILDVPHQAASATAEVWSQASAVLGEYLAGVTLADLARRQRQLDADARSMYFI